MTQKLPKLVATSVIRGSRQGESEGGVFKVNFENQAIEQLMDWNTSEIDFEGHSGDRGLRGIALAEEDIYIASSDVLFRCDRGFEIKTFSRNHYLDDCHEICRYEQTIFLTSPGFDSLLAFDIESKKFTWGYHLQRQYDQWAGHTFDPRSDTGPVRVNEYDINMVHVDGTGIYFSGSRTQALLHLDNQMEVSEVCSLPSGAHNARPFRDGLVFNDTSNDCVRYVGREGKNFAFKVPVFHAKDLQSIGMDDSGLVRQGFGRGLCLVGERFVAAGSSPSTISLYDLKSGLKVASVNLSMDVRSAIHGLEQWTFDG